MVCLAADSSDTQFTWLRALQEAGLVILPGINETEEKIRNATSIFDFEATSIDGETVSLNKYRLGLFVSYSSLHNAPEQTLIHVMRATSLS